MWISILKNVISDILKILQNIEKQVKESLLLLYAGLALMIMKIICTFVLCGLLALGTPLWCCTNFLITKGASTDGSTMISYAADSHVLFGELYHWAAAEYPEGTMMDVYEWDSGRFLCKIKQATRTYNVVGNMNEFQVAIGETTYTGRPELEERPPDALMDYGSMMYIALQRSKTAREAIKVMAELMAEHGYASTGESISVADKHEVWIFEVIAKGPNDKGSVWVTRRIPDGYICAHANQARITTFPLEDGKTSISSKNLHKIFEPDIECVYSEDVISFARAKGWYPADAKDENFSFSDTYNPVNFEGARWCEVRVWSMFRQVYSAMDQEQYLQYVRGHELKHRLPLWIKPDRKVSVQDMMRFMRDHLEGTEFDMTKDMGAGPFGAPYRWRPLNWKVDGVEYFNERATSTQQTGFSFVTQSRSWLPDAIGGILWFGVDDAASSVYVPMYASMIDVPETYRRGNGAMMDWSDNAAFWAFNQVSNFAYTRYSVIHPEIEQVQQTLENKFVAFTPAVDAAAQMLMEKDPKLGIQFLTDYSVNTGNQVVTTWKHLYQYLFLKYMDGNIKTKVPGQMNPKVKQPGYGEDWYRKIVKETGDKFKILGESSGH